MGQVLLHYFLFSRNIMINKELNLFEYSFKQLNIIYAGKTCCKAL